MVNGNKSDGGRRLYRSVGKMAILSYNNIRIEGISAVVPSTRIDNMRFSDFFSEKEAKSVIKMTGIAERRFTNEKTCASDLCVQAAINLFDKLDLKPEQIDAVIMVTLTPDYRMPATAFLLHQRLGLKKDCLAFDMSLGCSGFVYGLSMAANLLQQNNISRVLLLNGETKSKVYGQRDKSTSLLFGDAGTATLLSKTQDTIDTTITLNSDGSRAQAIIIEAGGYRNPSSLDSLSETLQEDGSWRSAQQGKMDGPAIFDFTITEVPKDISRALELAELSAEDIDFFVFHQANKFISDHIGKKLGVPQSKIPYSLDKYGNTASVSIPLTICSELYHLSHQNRKLCLSAFGVGLSWGTVITTLQDTFILPVSEI